MRKLFLIAATLLLTIIVYGQTSLAELEASYANTEQISMDPILRTPQKLKPRYRFFQQNTFNQNPIQIIEVPKTIYLSDRFENKLELESPAFPIEDKIVNTKTSSTEKIKLFYPLKNGDMNLIRTYQRFYILPFGIQQVNRTIYLGDRIETYYATKNNDTNINSSLEPTKKVYDIIEKEVVEVNSKTNASTSRGPIISKRELKAIVRRTKGKRDDYGEPIISPTSAEVVNSVKTKTHNRDLEETRIASSIHNVDHVKAPVPTKIVKPKYEAEVVNRELALLEKVMHQEHHNTTTASVGRPIPVTSQPLEVTSEVINGELEITEIKPAEASTPQEGENRLIKAESFSLTTIDDELITLNQMKGKVVVLNFWFTSCVECIREIPHLNDLKERYDEKDIEFVGVSLNDKTQIKSFLKKHPFSWKQIPNGRKLSHDYYMFVYPGHAVVDKNGGLITLLSGNEPEVMQQLETAIQVGLGETF